MVDDSRKTEFADEIIHIPEEIDFQHHTELPSTAISDTLDGIIRRIGVFASWFWIAVMVVILVSVISRYMFGQGSIMLEEITWHIYGAVWTVAMAYTFISDHHVRVDLLHERLGIKTQAWIELLGIIFLLLPFLIVIFKDAVPYFWDSYLQGETSQAPSGLAYRWALKFFLPFSFGLLIVAAVSRLLKCTALLFGIPSPLSQAVKTPDTGPA
jgi:TRAP-type mannitol/chloroaromatic compound transport system permease small subunit